MFLEPLPEIKIESHTAMMPKPTAKSRCPSSTRTKRKWNDVEAAGLQSVKDDLLSSHARYNRLYTLFFKANDLAGRLETDVAIMVVMDDINWLYSSKNAERWSPMAAEPVSSRRAPAGLHSR